MPERQSSISGWAHTSTRSHISSRRDGSSRRPVDGEQAEVSRCRCDDDSCMDRYEIDGDEVRTDLVQNEKMESVAVSHVCNAWLGRDLQDATGMQQSEDFPRARGGFKIPPRIKIHEQCLFVFVVSIFTLGLGMGSPIYQNKFAAMSLVQHQQSLSNIR